MLGFTFALAICVGSIIGGGILRTPGAVADRVVEPWLILLLWLAGGVHALLGANIVSEISTSVPQAGGLYVPTRRAFGDFAGLVVGWSDWLVNGAAAAALALAFADFAGLAHPFFASRETAVAVGILTLLFGINWLGVREGSVIQKLGSLAKCTLLFALVGTVFLLLPAAAAPAAPSASPVWTAAALVVAYQLVYGVYAGWPNAIYFIEEDERGAVNIPRAMGLSILLVTAVYLSVNAALLYALPVEALRSAELPAALALEQVLGGAGTVVIACLALVIVATCLNGMVMVLPRTLYGLGRDGLFVQAATRVNRGGTPDVALGLSALLATLLTVTGTFETVFLLMGALIMFMMVVTDTTLFALRIKEPRLERPYRAKGYPWLPALALILDMALFAAVLWAEPASGAYMLLLVAACLPIGLWLGRRNRGLKPVP
ncbi:MAG TPA: APC family permease [Allosphingosinicella sp.]|nr:APC family permease [Allosphingosinicella sp.]